MSKPSDTGNGKEPRFTEPIINQTITYYDGSAIQIILHSWPDQDMDDATRAYYNVLYPIMNELEQDAADVSD